MYESQDFTRVSSAHDFPQPSICRQFIFYHFLYLVVFGNGYQKWSGEPGGIAKTINHGKEMKHIGSELKSLLIHF